MGAEVGTPCCRAGRRSSAMLAVGLSPSAPIILTMSQLPAFGAETTVDVVQPSLAPRASCGAVACAEGRAQEVA